MGAASIVRAAGQDADDGVGQPVQGWERPRRLAPRWVAQLRAVLAGLLILLAALMPAAATDAPLRVGGTLLNKPWQFRDEKGAVVGFEADLVREIAAALGRPLVVEDMRFGELFPALSEGRIDLAMSSLSITPERREHFDFTQPYYQTTQAVAVMRRSPVRSLADLHGRSVSVIPETTSDRWVAANRARYRLSEVRRVRTLDEGLALLTAGEVDAHLGDMPALLYRLLGRSDLAVVARLGTQESYGLMLPKGSALTEPVNAIISRLKTNGTLARIHQTWFGIPPEPGSPVTQVLPLH